MIQVLGLKRIILIATLILINGALAAGYYLHVQPMNEMMEKQLRSVKGEISSKESELTRLQEEFEKIEEMRDRFQALETSGFFGEQDRVVARKKIEEIQEISRVLSASYVINAAKFEKNADLKKARHVMLSSPVSVSIEALDDIDVYRFIYLLQATFPGHVRVDRVELSRATRVNDSVIRQIGAGRPIPLVKAGVDFTWRTAFPEDRIAAPGRDRTQGTEF